VPIERRFVRGEHWGRARVFMEIGTGLVPNYSRAQVQPVSHLSRETRARPRMRFRVSDTQNTT
jgi:hypothetical protein